MAQVIDHETGEIMEPGPQPFAMLDPMAPGGVVTTSLRPDWIATISAGRNAAEPGKMKSPQVSRDGTIYIHEQAERNCDGLKAALVAGGGKRLTVTFPYDDLSGFIFQVFTKRSATALEVYGDQYRLVEIRDGSH